jgi:hypothetical protein
VVRGQRGRGGFQRCLRRECRLCALLGELGGELWEEVGKGNVPSYEGSMSLRTLAAIIGLRPHTMMGIGGMVKVV